MMEAYSFEDFSSLDLNRETDSFAKNIGFLLWKGPYISENIFV